MESPYSLDQLPIESSQVIRVSHYRITAGEFTGTSLDLRLDFPLEADYFVLLFPSANSTGPVAPSQFAARVTADPFTLGTATASDTITLTRGGGAGIDWVGTVVVVECLQPDSAYGFTLESVLEVNLPADATPPASPVQVNAAHGLASVTRVVPFGGLYGGGVSCASAVNSTASSVATNVALDATNVTVRRVSLGVLEDADTTVYLVRWGTGWTVQEAAITGSTGDADLDNAGAFANTPITQVMRARSWLWHSGGIAEGFTPDAQHVLVTLGNGVDAQEAESVVSACIWSASPYEATAWLLTASAASVTWTRVGSDTSIAPHLVTAIRPHDAEGYRTTSGIRFAGGGSRLALVHHGGGGNNGGDDPESLLFPIFATETSLEIRRADDDGTVAVTYWVQEVDFGFLRYTQEPTATPGPQQYIILPDLEMTAESISSITTEDGVRVGPVIPEDTNEGRLFPFHGGDPTTAVSLTYRLTTHGDLGEAGWVWQVEDATYWYGWNAADFVWGVYAWNDDVGTRYGVVGCYSTVFERLVLGYLTSSSAVNLTLRYHDLDADGAYESTLIGVQALDTTYTSLVQGANALIRMIELDDGSLRMLVLVTDPDGTWDWDVWSSRDGGDTWVLAASRIIQAANSGTALATRPVSVAFATSGDWLRIAWVDTAATLFTAASSSRGLAWTYIGDGTTPVTTGSNGNVADTYPLAMAGRNDGAGTFLLWIRDASNNYEVDAYTATREDEWVQDTDLDFTMGSGSEVEYLTVAATPEGFLLYALITKASTASIFFHGRVYDVDDPQGVQRTLGTESIPLKGMASRPHALQLLNAGREVLLVGSLLDWAGSAHETGILVGRLAGWSEVPIQGRNSSGYVPTEHWACLGGQPNSSTYGPLVHRSSGGPTIDASELRLQVTTTAGYGYWEWAGGSTWRTNGVGFGAMLRVPSSATLTRDKNVGVRVTTAPSGATGVSFHVAATTTMIALYDNVASSLKAYVATPAITQYLYEFRVGLEGTYNAFIAARQYEGVSGWKTRAEGWSRASATLSGSAGTTMDLLQWGNLDYAGAGTNTSEWREAWFAPGSTSEPGHVLQKTGMTWSDYRGRTTSVRKQRVYAGMDVHWGGGGGARQDSFAGEVALAHPRESIFLDSPRFHWQSAGDTQQVLVFDFGAGTDDGAEQRRTLHEAIALFGTRSRTATIEYNTADSWGSPLYTYEADATILADLYVRAVDGHAVLVEVPSSAMVPVAAAWEGSFLRILAGVTDTPEGYTWKVRKHGPARHASQVWLYLESEMNTQPLSAYVVQAGDTACIFAPRMAVRYGEPVRTRYMRVVLPEEDLAPTGKHSLGGLIAGPVVDFDPPLDWTWKDNEQPNTTRFTSKSGVTWGYQEGPAQRVWQARLVGDVTQRSRETLRNSLRLFASYDVRPVALVTDHAGLPESILYGYVTTGGQMENEGWFTDDAGKWRPGGDLPLQLVEVV